MDYIYKVSLLGDEFTGKTSLLIRFIKDEFSSRYKATLGADFLEKKFTTNDISDLKETDEIKMTIWDMAGQEAFKAMASIYLEGSLGLILVFDLNDPKTFESLDDWLKTSKEICENPEIIVVGNKNDLEQKVSDEDIKEFEQRHNIPIILTSAKEDINVNDVFKTIAKRIYQKNSKK